MDELENIFGCFVSIYETVRDADRDDAASQGALFRTYIWGDNGISKPLKVLKHKEYGKDLILILFQFSVNPPPQVVARLKPIESYRGKERSVGVPIIINDDNFFDRSETERRSFLKESIFAKMKLLRALVNRRRLDTDIDRLESDLIKIVTQWVQA